MPLNHQDHVRLLQGAIPEKGGQWADLGSGTGAFTLALADLIGPEGRITSVDRDRGALKQQEQEMRSRFPAVSVTYQVADFVKPLGLSGLDGIVMANSLHFVPGDQKPAVLAAIRSYLRLGGRLIMVEYNADQGNTWVPHPMSYPTWEALARQNGFSSTQLVATVPSRFLGQIFSAVSW